MVFEEIERLQREYTDKYVMVNPTRPELARFGDAVGLVKTINFNGRALVEFLDYHANTGWYDIGLDYLKIVPKPDPNAKKAEKPAPAAKAIPAAKTPAAKPAAAGGKSSTADILAAARAKAGGAPAAAKPAAAKPAAGGKPSTADILASLRAKGPATPAAAPAAAEPEGEEEAVAAPAAKVAAKKPAAAKPAGPKPTTTAEKIEWCRQADAKG